MNFCDAKLFKTIDLKTGIIFYLVIKP